MEIPLSEVRWVVMVSGSMGGVVSEERVIDIIEQEMRKISEGYRSEQAGEHACKRLILETVEYGGKSSVSCVILMQKNEGGHREEIKHVSWLFERKRDVRKDNPEGEGSEGGKFEYFGQS